MWLVEQKSMIVIWQRRIKEKNVLLVDNQSQVHPMGKFD